MEKFIFCAVISQNLQPVCDRIYWHVIETLVVPKKSLMYSIVCISYNRSVNFKVKTAVSYIWYRNKTNLVFWKFHEICYFSEISWFVVSMVFWRSVSIILLRRHPSSPIEILFVKNVAFSFQIWSRYKLGQPFTVNCSNHDPVLEKVPGKSCHKLLQALTNFSLISVIELLHKTIGYHQRIILRKKSSANTENSRKS